MRDSSSHAFNESDVEPLLREKLWFNWLIKPLAITRAEEKLPYDAYAILFLMINFIGSVLRLLINLTSGSSFSFFRPVLQENYISDCASFPHHSYGK